MMAIALDQPARDRALDTGRSFIVQAPAGSGKTELLTRRLLALLAVVDSPEEILAVTFTRKAAAEMRNRVAEALRKASTDSFGEREDEQKRTLARRALARSRDAGWRLEENPARLRISTLDGFNSYLAGRLPWLSRLGGVPGVVKDAQELYGEAADRVIRHIEGDDGYAAALEVVLGHLDNRASKLREYLISFLTRRDQWLRKRQVIGDPDLFRPALEAALGELITERLAQAHRVLYPRLVEMATLASYAAGNLKDREQGYALEGSPGTSAEHARHWRSLAAAFLTKGGVARKRPDASIGWPKEANPELKARMAEVLEELGADEEAQAALASVAKLPDPVYSEAEWRIVAPIVRVADLSLACLFLEFCGRREVDFTETALRGLEALGKVDEPSELMLALDKRLTHILVDEFQDTSHLQFELLKRLTQGWSGGDGRTLFLVGDPMQSIYRFREAEVGLFYLAREVGVGGLALESLRLEVNFRSESGLIERFNEVFPAFFPGTDEPASGGVPFARSVAHVEGGGVDSFSFHPLPAGDLTAEAAEVVAAAREALLLDDRGTVAILVRARTHLPAIMRELKRSGLSWRGEDLDPLGERLAVKDVMSLARALADPADRLSWLAVLRAPWCGVTLDDAHALLFDDSRPVPQIIPEVLADTRLRADSAARLARFWRVAGPALEEVGRRPFRNLVEGVWALLGAPAWLDAQETEDVAAALALLTETSPGSVADLSGLERALKGLYSRPDPTGDARLQVMTIHKAKGLEFDTVLLPGLGRRTGRSGRELISWQETTSGGLVVGVAREVKAGASGGIADFLAELEKKMEANELTRLLYVAATRAKKRLRLWGGANWNAKTGEWRPVASSLLEVLWPAAAPAFSKLPPPGDYAVPEADYAEAPVILERLESGWTPPRLSTPAIKRRQQAVVEVEEPVYDWAREERKLVGIVSHQLFDRFGREGIGGWTLERLKAEQDTIAAKLSELGVPDGRLKVAVSGVVEAARGLLEDETGRWLFTPSFVAETEFSLSSVRDGRVQTRRIDRTFIDSSGVRWVVDFKITPHEGGDLEGFLASQSERYRNQMAEYAELFRMLEPERPVRAAIYYPLLNRLVEMET